MKKMEWVEQRRNECLSLIQNAILELDVASKKLTTNELSVDKEDFKILFPGCASNHLDPPNLYTYCVACRINGVKLQGKRI